MLSKLLINKVQRQVTSEKGFTLVELLIVIAIIGVLAGVLLIALNPFEQFAKGRDAGRVYSVNQLGRAMLTYVQATASSSSTGVTYPAVSTSWQTTYLVSTNEIQGALSVAAGKGGAVCSPAADMQTGTNLCYVPLNSNADAAVWAVAESGDATVRAGGGTACVGTAVIAYIASQGKTGYDCIPTARSPFTPNVGDRLY